MIKNADRFPGTEFQEEIVLDENNTLTNQLTGSISLISGSFTFKDDIGIFNPRNHRDGFYFRDDFIGDSLLPNWNTLLQGNGSVINVLNNEPGGIISLTSGGGSGRFAQLDFGAIQTLSADKNVSLFCRFQYKQTANSFTEISLRAGAGNRIRIHKTGNNNIFFSTHSGGVETSIDTLIVPDTNYHTAEIKTINGGTTAQFYYDKMLKVSVNTNITTNKMEVFFYQESTAGNTRSLNIDMVEIRQDW